VAACHRLDELEALAPSSDAQQDRSDWHPQKKETP